MSTKFRWTPSSADHRLDARWDGQTLTSNWLFSQWGQCTTPGSRSNVRVRQITHTAWPQKTVELLIPGSVSPREIIVIGAHLDSIAGGASTSETQRAPGADDDASGVASMTDIIRVLVTSNDVPKRSARFIAYAAAEVGLRGSRDVVLEQQSMRRDRVLGVLQLDMVAYSSAARHLAVHRLHQPGADAVPGRPDRRVSAGHDLWFRCLRLQLL